MSEEEVLSEENMPKKKHFKGLTKMFKSIKGAGLSAGSLGGVFSAMELLSPLLKPLEVVMKIIGGLFAAMAAEILPPLMEALEPVFDMLMDLTPLFTEIGVYIGELVAEFLPPLITILLDFMEAIKPLIPKIMEIIRAVMELAMKVLPILIDIFLKVADIVLAVLKPILDWLGSLSAAELGAVIYAFGLGLSAIWGFMHMGGPWGAAAATAIWATTMVPLLSMQEGGIAMSPTRAMVGDVPGGEIVAPLTPFNRRMDSMITAQEETNRLLSQMYEEKLFRHTLEGF